MPSRRTGEAQPASNTAVNPLQENYLPIMLCIVLILFDCCSFPRF